MLQTVFLGQQRRGFVAGLKRNCPFSRPAVTVSLSTTAATTTKMTMPAITAADLQRQRQDVLQEAAALTRSLYRLCMRSVKLIAAGNDADQKEFEEREERQLQEMTESIASDERLSGIISMLPPVNPAAELHARSQYYAQYTAENFIAEMDCLRSSNTDEQGNDNDIVVDLPDQNQFARYFYYLRKGEEDRKWLLQDMKFDNPYQFDLERVDRLEDQVKALFQAKQAYEWQQLAPEQQRDIQQAQRELEDYDTDEEAFSDDESDDEDGYRPMRYKNPDARLDENDEDY